MKKEQRGVPNARKPMTRSVTYKNQDLMNDLNEMMIRIKRHLYCLPTDSVPTEKELDSLQNRLMEALKHETEPTIHYYD